VIDLVWPPMARRYTLRVGVGRLLHAILLVLGSLGVLLELVFWHGRMDHLASYFLMWVGAAVIGRGIRAVLSRE
jgi:hypothetical protein